MYQGEAAEADFYKSGPLDSATYPRLQILTIQQILDGKQPNYPVRRDASFKRAPRSRPAPVEKLTLPRCHQNEQSRLGTKMGAPCLASETWESTTPTSFSSGPPIPDP